MRKNAKDCLLLYQIFVNKSNNMTKTQFTSLPESHTKVVLYFSYIAFNIWEFSLSDLLKLCNLTKTEFFTILRDLSDFEIIRIILDDHSCSILVQIFEYNIDLMIFEWGDESINLLNTITFKNDITTLKFALNEVYKHLVKYNDETMIEYLNPEIPIRPIEIPKEYERKREKKKERKEIRKDMELRAKTLVEIFYLQLSKHISIQLTDRLRETEIYAAREFFKQFPEFPIEFVLDGIKWFLSHTFWSKVILNLDALRKHFPKYLAEERGLKKTRMNKLKIIG
ncbi:MAG: hypothetical protein ACFFKA_12900 [Candidatus Thorarchaeota archaeon]